MMLTTPALTAATMVHATGTSGADLLAATRARRDATEPAPPTALDFDIVRDLGRKGTRTLDRAAALAIHAVGQLPQETRSPADEEPRRVTGLVLATTMGSLQSTMDFTRDSFTGARPFHVDPARFPNTVMNFAAGQCAIRYGIKGPNATVTTGHVGSFTAVRYAARLLRAGRAERIIAGASEELSQARAAVVAAAGESNVPLTEGAGAVVVELCDPAHEHVDILAQESALATESGDMTTILVGLMQRAVRAVTEHLGRPPRIALMAPRDAEAHGAELGALHLLLGRADAAGVEVLDTTSAVGDLGSAAGLAQLQVGMAALADLDAGPADCLMVTGTDREGALAVMVLRRHEGVAA